MKIRLVGVSPCHELTSLVCPWPEGFQVTRVVYPHDGEGGGGVEGGNEDGADYAGEEAEVVPPADALVEPLAVVVEGVHALVAGGAVLGALAGNADLAQVATAVLDHVGVTGSGATKSIKNENQR